MTAITPTTRRLLAGFIIAALTVLATMGLVLQQMKRASNDERWVEHTYVVMAALDGIVGAIYRAESTQRAFLVSRDPQDFVTRDESMSRVESLLIDVGELTADNPQQLARLPDLKRAVATRVDSMNAVMVTLTDVAGEAARQRLISGAADTQAVIDRVRIMREDEEQLLVQRRAAADADSRWTRATLIAVLGMFLAAVAVFFARIRHDILQRERAEAKALEAQRAAEAANRSKSEFLANMSHEIRTPLNAIMGLTHLALDSDLQGEQRDNLLKVSRSSFALRNILNDILDYSKIEAGRLEIDTQDVEVEEVLISVSDLFCPAAEEKGLAFNIEIAPDVPRRMRGDPLRIGQVLNNLVGNAIKFTKAGEIRILAATFNYNKQDWLNVTVLDTGCGVAPEMLDRLFDPFVQADSSISRRFGGTGLGLAICRRLVTLMGGTMGVSSRVGQGSRFHFSLPLTRVEDAPARPDLGDVKALVVDDQATAAEIVCAAIRAANGEAVPLTDPTRVVALLEEAAKRGAAFNLAVLDWLMPDLDGVACAAAIEAWSRTSGNARPLTIMMMTAHNRDRLAQAARGVAVDSMLAKPILPSTLYQAIHMAMHPGQAPPRAVRSTPAPAVSMQGARVLLVEDNALNQEVAAKLLRKAGIEVTIAENGLRAIERVESAAFDAILMDMQMPEMDGLEATRRIRRMPGGERVPIIALTAAAMPGEKQACADAGMNDHVAKPIDPAELFSALGRWIAIEAPGDVPANSDFPEIAGLDRASLITRLGGDRALLHSLLRQFVAQSAGSAMEIGALINAQAYGEAARLAHTLGGVSGNLSALAIADLCRQIEAAAPLGPSPALDRAVTALSPAVAALSENFSRYLGSVAEVAGDSSLDQEALAQLLDSLSREDFDALEQFAELRPSLESRYGARLTKVSDAMASLRFTEALGLLLEFEGAA